MNKNCENCEHYKKLEMGNYGCRILQVVIYDYEDTDVCVHKVIKRWFYWAFFLKKAPFSLALSIYLVYSVSIMIEKGNTMFKTLIKYTENDKIKTFDVENEVNTTEKASVDTTIAKYIANNLTIANLVAIETYEVA